MRCSLGWGARASVDASQSEGGMGGTHASILNLGPNLLADQSVEAALDLNP